MLSLLSRTYLNRDTRRLMGMGMIVRRRWWRIRNRPTFDCYGEGESRNTEPSRRITLGLLILGMALCALVFQKGLKEAQLKDKCDLSNGTSCSTIASNP
jgi:hypothetical protein